MSSYFSEDTFRFLRALKSNNRRDWFEAHRADYLQHLRDPFLRLIGELQPGLAGISPHYRADPRGNGGSLFRIHRDTRFANDKTPYKTWGGARFFHERAKQVHAPSFYLHLEPGGCFIGAGLWHPEPETQRRIRAFLFDNPAGWTAATRSAAFRRRFALTGDSLVRPPRGYPADHPLIDDLKRKDFVATAPLADELVLGPRLRQAVISHFTGLAPLVDYLCAALDLEF
ncbi:DUF2461 domain-containing protein [Arenimonas composti]|uniref:TIGR02453 family protein n=1 Tax=Arenimonas composti TR7-09 = DSM 18010 TaxID=1121013 RepID=A0A091BH96_9GAMM|nr:DUF2461 domain-containing protein [Arenimonas composti]KFN50897.1 hypothetical protein P873_00685 [Arenimonas composti TR7-09 = DSM 18010]